ncbi:MAG: hypothetical protein WGN25_11630 [Candidatus Electrothrix sp. GW3-4]|uniref:hypothetical protein n=1 Tax=Candidatus Electrothrix sp. GW3-4 TaxID=3126740 RepID=UPI0030D33918
MMRRRGRTWVAAISLTTLWLLLPGAALAERNKVAFLHVQDKILKEDCVEIKGAQDGAASYTCKDEKGNVQPMTPNAEWVVVKAERVCFHHKVRDIIRICTEITPQEEDAVLFYTCSIRDEPPQFFEPTARWEKLARDDKRCISFLQTTEVLSPMMGPGLPDRGGNDAKQE